MCSFAIYNLDDFRPVGEESMGSKARDWHQTTAKLTDLETGKRWLFKVPDRFQGEIWSEKIAQEVGSLMGLPIARVELAQQGAGDQRQRGTISLSFADSRDGLSLEHGNELMERQGKVKQYVLDKEDQVGLDAVYDYLDVNNVQAPIGADKDKSASFYFTGYLVLDALIGNVDRHHQNWGVVRTSGGDIHLAPTFDHGACLGRELQEKKRLKYLEYKQVERYATNNKAHAKIAPPGDNDRTTPFGLLDFLPDLGQDQALCFWLERALGVDANKLELLFDRVPTELVSSGAREFAQAFTSFTRDKLGKLHQDRCQ